MQKTNYCQTCGKPAHDFQKEEVLNCVPPRNVLKFGNFQIDSRYREALFEEHPNFNTEDIMGSYLGKNKLFQSEEDWLRLNIWGDSI